MIFSGGLVVGLAAQEPEQTVNVSTVHCSTRERLICPGGICQNIVKRQPAEEMVLHF
jgi:hypothetical protein